MDWVGAGGRGCGFSEFVGKVLSMVQPLFLQFPTEFNENLDSYSLDPS